MPHLQDHLANIYIVYATITIVSHTKRYQCLRTVPCIETYGGDNARNQKILQPDYQLALHQLFHSSIPLEIRLNPSTYVKHRTLRISGSPTQLKEEVRSWRVRSKRVFDGGHL